MSYNNSIGVFAKNLNAKILTNIITNNPIDIINPVKPGLKKEA